MTAHQFVFTAPSLKPVIAQFVKRKGITASSVKNVVPRPTFEPVIWVIANDLISS